MGSLLKSTIEQKIRPILLNLYQKIEWEGILLNSMYESDIILIPKLDKDITRK